MINFDRLMGIHSHMLRLDDEIHLVEDIEMLQVAVTMDDLKIFLVNLVEDEELRVKDLSSISVIFSLE
jgi:hypothetical protein